MWLYVQISGVGKQDVHVSCEWETHSPLNREFLVSVCLDDVDDVVA